LAIRFHKNLLEFRLSPFGEVAIQRPLDPETTFVDVYFVPKRAIDPDPELTLLAQCVANQTTEPEEQELLMQLSPLYLEQLETARSEGEVRGELKGRQELVLRLLDYQIPGASAAVEATIRTLSAAQLDTFGEALLGFQSADDLRAWLAENA
jgi:Domain of unknown function (DUF4351)